MKTIAIKLIALTGLIVLFDQIGGRVLDRLFWRDPFNATSRAIEQKADILFLGASRDKHGIIPKIIEEKTGLTAYNTAYDGAGILYMRGLTALFAASYKPKLMVVSVIHLDQERGDIRKLAPYFDQPDVRRLLDGYPWRVKVKYAWLRLPRYNSSLLRILRRNFKNPDLQKGYEPFYGQMGASIPDAGNFAAIMPGFKAGDQQLGELIQEAKRHSVPLVLLELPTFREKSSLSYFSYKQMAAEHGVPFFDYSQGGADELALSPDCFFEEGHLNDKGAQIVSADLGQKIKELLIPA